MQIVSGDVLHHAPAALGQISFACHEFHSEHVIARRAEKLPQRIVHARRNRSTNRRAIEEGNAEWKKLMLLGQHVRQFVQRNSGFDAQSKISGVVCDDTVEPRHINRNVVSRRRHSDAEL